MDLKLFVLIIVILDLSQEGFSFKLPASSKLDNGELFDSILKSKSPLNRIDLKAKCNACKRQHKCKLQEACAVCDKICDKYQSVLRTDKNIPYFKPKKDVVGISQRTSENLGSSDNEDRYYTVGAFKDGPVQNLLQRLLNLNIREQTDHMIVMMKPKSRQPHPVNHPVIIDTAHVFTPNKGDVKKIEMELHKVGEADENTEKLVETLDQKFENFVNEKRKANMDPHLMPEEIDEIIEKTILEEKQPKVTSRVTEHIDEQIESTNEKEVPAHHAYSTTLNNLPILTSGLPNDNGADVPLTTDHIEINSEKQMLTYYQNNNEEPAISYQQTNTDHINDQVGSAKETEESTDDQNSTTLDNSVIPTSTALNTGEDSPPDQRVGNAKDDTLVNNERNITLNSPPIPTSKVLDTDGGVIPMNYQQVDTDHTDELVASVEKKALPTHDDDTIILKNSPVSASKIPDDDVMPLIDYQLTNTDHTNEHIGSTNLLFTPPSNDHRIRHEQHTNQVHGDKILKSHAENVALTPIVQPTFTYDDAEKSTLAQPNLAHQYTTETTMKSTSNKQTSYNFGGTANENREITTQSHKLSLNKKLVGMTEAEKDISQGTNNDQEESLLQSKENQELFGGEKDENKKANIIKPLQVAEVVQKSSEMVQNHETPSQQENLKLENHGGDTDLHKDNWSEPKSTVESSIIPDSNVEAAQIPKENTKTTLNKDQESLNQRETTSPIMHTPKKNTENIGLPRSSIIPDEIPRNTAIKLIPFSDPKSVLDNIQADIEKSASKLAEDVAVSAKQTNDKIKDMVQQIFPESLRNLEEVTLQNNKKFRTNLTPEEQNILSQRKGEPKVELTPPLKDIYRKHPRTETVYSNGTFVTNNTPPKKPPYDSKHREADAISNQPEFVRMDQKDNTAAPFIDRNLLNVNSVINNVHRTSESVLDNLKELVKPEDKVKTQNVKDAKDRDSVNSEEVACKEDTEKVEYLNVDPPSTYDSLYRHSAIHVPTLDQMLYTGRKPHHMPLNFLPKKAISSDSKYKAANANFSEEQEEKKDKIVESKHRNLNLNNHYRHLGKIIPREHEIIRRDTSEQINHKSMFFVGDGIKLPLTLKEFTDGSLHLSIDVKALCNCKHCKGLKLHNTTEIVGDAQNSKEIADIPLKVYDSGNIPANAVSITQTVLDNVETLNLAELPVEEKKGLVKRSVWNNNIKKIDEATISSEKFHFLRDIFRFMKNLVSDDIDAM